VVPCEEKKKKKVQLKKIKAQKVEQLLCVSSGLPLLGRRLLFFLPPFQQGWEKKPGCERRDQP
jgi:hypothetical protein